ncbi:hypothetical protein LSM04_009598 [Trypanosoma melophagium]|uniref:uncharacterized protein n=1 Tax=Trypanosoma melophagium TaxID=715481 RepID=UPI00351A038F|nr:hypothetical protein LSM04_009598 [Trypanosoma melophagium]
MIRLRQRQQLQPREQQQQEEGRRKTSLSRTRPDDAFSDEIEEDRERSLQRLPASIQAMLLRAKRTLSTSELNIMAGATADHRCEALRMIFEGKSADEAVSFLLNVSDRTKNGRTTSGTVVTVIDPPTRAATMHSTVGDGERSSSRGKEVSTSSNNKFHPIQHKIVERATHCVLNDSDIPPSPLQVAPIPSKREAKYNGHTQRPLFPISTVMSHCHNAPDSDDGEVDSRLNSPSIQAPSVRTQKSQTPVQPLGEVRVNTFMYPTPVLVYKEKCSNAPVLAKRKKSNENRTVERPQREMDSRAAPTDMYAAQVSCSAWDEHYKTFIVHPNQLHRLEEERQLRAPPAAVRPGTSSALRRLPSEERRKFSRQNTPSARLRPRHPASLINSLTPLSSSAADTFDRNISSNYADKKVSLKAIQSHHQERFTKDDKQNLSTPVVPSLKGMRKCTRRKEDVFTRLYSSHNPCLTPRTAISREIISARGVRSGITTPRCGFQRRNSPATNNRTPRRRGETMNDYPFGISTPNLMSFRRRRLGTSRTDTLSDSKGVSLAGANFFMRSYTSAVKPLSRSFSAQKLHRTSTAVNYTYRYNNDGNIKSNFDYHYNRYARTPTWRDRYQEYAVQREERNVSSKVGASSHYLKLRRSATMNALR